MKKVLKFYSVILLAVLVFSFWSNFAKAGNQGICYPCCVKTNCISGADCVGSKSDGDNPCKQGGTDDKPIFSGDYGQCKDPNKITYCSFSSNKEIKDLVNKVSNWALVIALVVAPLMILLGAFYMLTAAGDSKRSTKGKQIIIWASIGLAIFLFAKAFISILKSFLW
ncbi:MAG: pilin [bacterium]